MLLALTILLSLLNCVSLVSAENANQGNNSNLSEMQYSQAKDYYYLLLRDNKVQSDRRNWLKGISEFRRMYHGDPQGEFAASCLFMMAKMYYRMYMRFYQEKDLDESIANYSDVYTLFPDNTLADDALFWAAEIYLKDKKNPRQAAKLYAKQITLYPLGDKYGQAASRLQELKGKYNFELPEKYSVSRDTKTLMQVPCPILVF
ncbi:MAG: hypothetical protein OEM01_11225 [Desulfobulbaceae bacterium]|nr:hypothetical protein [Desulfobulbaceae bacterium]